MAQEQRSSVKEAEGGKPWWREPWPWILMAGPAAAIVGCIITIVLAVQNFGDQAITDGGIKRGLVVSKQVQTPPPEKP
ncbi:MAG TPA: FixH family protein [Pusillimonas sp.]